MTWEQIETVNKEITTVDIKGKPYAEVHKRILAFRKLMPNGVIVPEIISNVNGVVVMKCTIIDDKNKVLAVAHSYEKEDFGFINKTSYIENCETSVIGRALGLCGIGIDTSVASADEVNVAIEKQSLLKMPISKERLEMIENLIEETNTDLEKFLRFHKIKSLNEITFENVTKIEGSLLDKKAKQ